MSGNVWEWTRSGRQDYPYTPKDGRDDISLAEGRVLRGGSFLNYLPEYARSAYRLRYYPPDLYRGFGFRVAISLSPETVPLKSDDMA